MPVPISFTKLLTAASLMLECQLTPSVWFLHLLPHWLVQDQGMGYYTGQLGHQEVYTNHSQTHLQPTTKNEV